MRWLSLVAGIALVALAFAAATRVSDTRGGLIAEVITLLGGLAGVSLLMYGLTVRKRPAPAAAPPPTVAPLRPRSTNDLVLGGGGIALGLILLGGLALSAGLGWAALGLALLLPMIAGSVYLCVRFLRANP